MAIAQVISSNFITKVVPRQASLTLAPGCTSLGVVYKNDNCTSIAAQRKISPAQLYALSPFLGADGSSCATALWENFAYCVTSAAASNQLAYVTNPREGQCEWSGKSFPVNPATTSITDGSNTVFGIDY